MGIVTEQRIKELDRFPSGKAPSPVRKKRWATRARRSALRAAIKKRRRVPMRAFSPKGVERIFSLQMIRLRCRSRTSSGEDAIALEALLERSKDLLAARERMLYWKRDELWKIEKRRRPSIKHKINRAQYNRELFRLKEENNARFAELESQRHA